MKKTQTHLVTFYLSSFNDAIDKSYFHNSSQTSEYNCVLKKGERYSKDKLIPIRILPNVPKVFEKCMFRQMSNYMDNFLSKHQSSFRKEYNTQY